MIVWYGCSGIEVQHDACVWFVGCRVSPFYVLSLLHEVAGHGAHDYGLLSPHHKHFNLNIIITNLFQRQKEIVCLAS